MKKIVITLLTASLLLSTVSCKNNTTEPKTTITATPSTISTPAMETSAPTATPMVSHENTTNAPLNTFTLDITLDVKQHKLVVKQNLEYNNNTGKSLSNLYFNLIPNAFKKDGGGIQMHKLMIQNKDCKMKQVKETVYKVDLPTALKDKDKLTIQMQYDVKIPNIQNRFGYQKNVYNVGNFIVTPAVYEKKGWSVEPYVDLGDAFYSDIANYNVTIHTPKGYIVAATGTESGQGTYEAKNVRDFAFCASNTYKIMQEDYEGTKLKLYYNGNIKKTATRIMDSAKKSLKLYNEVLGKYPYDTLSLIVNGLSSGIGGMEYPTLVMLAPEFPIEEPDAAGTNEWQKEFQQQILRQIDNTTCHEIAHQWFYGIVGNDQIKNSWIDEGMARYCEYLYKKAYPNDSTYETLAGLKESMDAEHDSVAYSGKKNHGIDDADLNYTLYDWMKNDPMEYGGIYQKGRSLIYQMQLKMGEEAFGKALKEYVSHFSYQFVTPDSFKKFWMSKGDFSDLFKMYLKKIK